jgi:hypothetical protein
MSENASGLLDPNEIKKQMMDPPKTREEILKDILENGVDKEHLQELKKCPVDEKNLLEYATLEEKDRLARLDLVVERLMLRVNRLELENEKRYLELIGFSLKFTEFVNKWIPIIAKLYNHFFAEPEKETEVKPL